MLCVLRVQYESLESISSHRDLFLTFNFFSGGQPFRILNIKKDASKYFRQSELCHHVCYKQSELCLCVLCYVHTRFVMYVCSFVMLVYRYMFVFVCFVCSLPLSIVVGRVKREVFLLESHSHTR